MKQFLIVHQCLSVFLILLLVFVFCFSDVCQRVCEKLVYAVIFINRDENISTVFEEMTVEFVEMLNRSFDLNNIKSTNNLIDDKHIPK